MENRNITGIKSFPSVSLCWPVDDGFQNYFFTQYHFVEIKDIIFLSHFIEEIIIGLTNQIYLIEECLQGRNLERLRNLK